ncbi:MAG: MFS transporter [Desulfobacteraceae bacterium]|nr:MFS transporter [Desulfobacteraceae bacterium]
MIGFNKIFYGWIIAVAGFLISVIGLGMRYSFGVFLESIEVDFVFSRAATSSIFSVYMLLSAIMAVIGGWVMDKYGPRKITLFMGLFTGLSLFLTSLVQSPWQLFLTYSLLLAMGTGAIFGIINTTASRWFSKKKGLVIGITSSGGGVGAIVFAPFATYLISSFDWRTAFMILGIIAGAGIIILSLFLVKEPSDLGLFPDGVKPDLRKNKHLKNNPNPPAAGISLGMAWKMKQFWFLGIVWLLLSLSLHMIFVHSIPYATGMGVSPIEASYILSLLGISNIPGRLVIGKISDIFGRGNLGIFCLLIQFASLLWLLASSQLWMLYTFAVIYGFLWGGAGVIITSLIGDIFGTSQLGVIMGILSGGWAVGAAIGPAIGGFIFDVSGDYLIAFGVCAMALITAAFLLGLMLKARKTPVTS